MPAISVIVPVYKVEPYLRRCVDSVLAQTFTDFELVLVDDGSPDNCPVICDEYAVKDNRVKVIHKSNGGVSSARNVGLKNAVGEYVTFVDSDDCLNNIFLETTYHALIDTKADMALAGYSYVSPNSEITTTFLPQLGLMSGREALSVCCNLDNSLIRAPWCKLIRTSIAKKYLFPTDRSYSEDFATIYKWMYDCKTISGAPEAVYEYFLSDTGVSRSFNPYWLDNFKTLDEIIAFLDSHKMDEEAQLYRDKRISFWFYCLENISNYTCPKYVHMKLKTKLHAAKRQIKEDELSRKMTRFKLNSFYYFVYSPFVNIIRRVITHLRNGGVKELLLVLQRRIKRNQQ